METKDEVLAKKAEACKDTENSDENYESDEDSDTSSATTQNIIAFACMYFIEGISYGQIVAFIPLVLSNIYGLTVAKTTFTYIVLLPWLIKPLYAYCLPRPTLNSLKFVWILLVLITAKWLYMNCYVSFISMYHKVLIYGFLIQLLTAFLDVIVDYVQVCTLTRRKTLGWVKTLEVGLYKIGGMLGGSVLMVFTTNISYSIATLLISYIVLGFLALYVFKLPEIPKNLEEKSNKETNSVDKSDKNDSNSAKLLENSENSLKKPKTPIFKTMYNTKAFFIYLLTYKLFQGCLQRLLPLWMTVEAGYHISTANLICGFFPNLTSFLGTVVGGGIPAYLKKRHLKLRKSESSNFVKIVSDIWLWLEILTFCCSVVVICILGNIELKSNDLSGIKHTTETAALFKSSLQPTSHPILELTQPTTKILQTNQVLKLCAINETTTNPINCRKRKLSHLEKNLNYLKQITFIFSDGLGLSVNVAFFCMFIVITFIGGIITSLTFTEMTAKAQDNVDIEYANQYLSWLSTTEVVGKYVFGILCGSIAKAIGYYWSFILGGGLHFICISSYIVSKFETETVKR